jgi:hypothetical protein
VQWLNGFESVLHNVKANQALTVSDDGLDSASDPAPVEGGDPG